MTILYDVTKTIASFPFSTSTRVGLWVGRRLQTPCCISSVYSPAVGRGRRPICVTVLLVDIKSWAVLARRGCAFVGAWWRECAIVLPLLPPFFPLFLYLSAHFVHLCACTFSVCLSVPVLSPGGVCLRVCVCGWRRAPWCDAFFIHLAVSFTRSCECFYCEDFWGRHRSLTLTLTPSSVSS